jgi:sulfite dehydrogenase (cytochrome) subunit A
MLDRRQLFKRAGIGAMAVSAGGAAGIIGSLADEVTLPIGNGERPLVRYPVNGRSSS